MALQVSNAMKRKSQTYQADDIILVTGRKVSDKVQPNVRVQGLYVVESVGTLKSGSVSLLCHDYGDAKRTHRINEERFVWRKVSKGELAAAERRVFDRIHAEIKEKQEKEFKERCAKTHEELMEKFSWHDHVQIAFVPLIISHIAWVYAEKTRKWCADNRISEVKGLSRAVLKIRQDYIDFLRKDLDMKHISNIERQTEAFMAEPKTAMFFTIMFHSLSNEYHRLHKEVPLLPCRVYATISRLAIDAYVRHNDRMNRLIAGKLGDSESVNNPLVTDKLVACMDAYLGDWVLPKTPEVIKTEKIFDNYIKDFEFEVSND